MPRLLITIKKFTYRENFSFALDFSNNLKCSDEFVFFLPHFSVMLFQQLYIHILSFFFALGFFCLSGFVAPLTMHECLDSIYFPPDSFAFLFFCPINYAEVFGFNFIASFFSHRVFFAFWFFCISGFLPLFSCIKGAKKTGFDCSTFEPVKSRPLRYGNLFLF